MRKTSICKTVVESSEREGKGKGKKKTNLIRPQQRRHQLIDLHERDMLPQTDMRPPAKLKHGSFHIARRLGVAQPPLGTIGVAIVAKGLPVALHDPGVAADDGPARDGDAADLGPGGRDDAFEHGAEGGTHAEGFLDAGVEVGQLAGLGEGGLEVGGCCCCCCCCWCLCRGGREVCVEFLTDLGIAARGAEDVVEDGEHGDGAVGRRHQTV